MYKAHVRIQGQGARGKDYFSMPGRGGWDTFFVIFMMYFIKILILRGRGSRAPPPLDPRMKPRLCKQILDYNFIVSNIWPNHFGSFFFCRELDRVCYKTCEVLVTYSSLFYTSCGWWGWSRCAKYKWGSVCLYVSSCISQRLLQAALHYINGYCGHRKVLTSNTFATN